MPRSCKLLTICLTLAVSITSAVALADDPNETRLLTAIQKLDGENQLFLDIEGTDAAGAHFKDFLYWQFDPIANDLKAHIVFYKGGKLVRRVVADGENVYDYDLLRYQFSATNYGGYRGRPTNYVSLLAYYLDKLSEGPASYGAKLLREIDDAKVSSVYRSWMPGVTPTQLSDGAHTDPVAPTVFTYVETPTTNYVQYNLAPKKALTFQLEDDSPSPDFKLSAIYLTETQTLDSATVTSGWSLTISKGIVFDQSNFTPYTAAQIKGWKQILGPTPIKS